MRAIPTEPHREYGRSGAQWLVLFSPTLLVRIIRRIAPISPQAIAPGDVADPPAPPVPSEDGIDAIAHRGLAVFTEPQWKYLGVIATPAIDSVQLTDADELTPEITVRFAHEWIEVGPSHEARLDLVERLGWPRGGPGGIDPRAAFREGALGMGGGGSVGLDRDWLEAIDRSVGLAEHRRRRLVTTAGTAKLRARADLEIRHAEGTSVAISHLNIDDNYSNERVGSIDITPSLDAVRAAVTTWLSGKEITPEIDALSSAPVHLARTDDRHLAPWLAVVGGVVRGGFPAASTGEIVWWARPEVAANAIRKAWSDLTVHNRRVSVTGFVRIADNEYSIRTRFEFAVPRSLAATFADPAWVPADGSDDAFLAETDWTAEVVEVRRGGRALAREDWPAEMPTDDSGNINVSLYLNRSVSSGEHPEMKRFFRQLVQSVTWQIRNPILSSRLRRPELTINSMHGILGSGVVNE